MTAVTGFRHEALFYSGRSEFLERTTDFVLDGVRAGEPVFVVVPPDKVELLRDALGADGRSVRFADMTEVGRNPGRIISAWVDFAAEHDPAQPLRGIGEPIWEMRDPDELVECQHHEALLNVAFAAGPPFWLVCPYDREQLDVSVLEAAERTHPILRDGRGPVDSAAWTGPPRSDAVLEVPLAEPPPGAESLVFRSDLRPVRELALRKASRAGVTGDRADEVLVAVNEIATNSVRHGGGEGRLRCWLEEDALVFEVSDLGRIGDAMVGRRRPALGQLGGYGVWLANQLADLLQIRTVGEGTVVRLRFARPSTNGRRAG